jgi:hypothetical protein
MTDQHGDLKPKEGSLANTSAYTEEFNQSYGYSDKLLSFVDAVPVVSVGGSSIIK